MKLSQLKKLLLNILSRNLALVVLLSVGLVIFLYSYWANIDRPGAISDRGWYVNWADQRRYYEQAEATSNLNLNSKNFYYPILYPSLGALFIKFFPKDPFVFVNLFLFLLTTALLYKFIEDSLGRKEAVAGVLLIFSMQRVVYDFVVPWTTSLTTPLLLASAWIVFKFQYSNKKLFYLSFLTGLAFLTRYTDIIFFLPFVFLFSLKGSMNTSPKLLNRFMRTAIGLIGFLLIFLIINLKTSNNILGPYISRNVSRFGFHFNPLTLYEKFIGYFFNSFIYHRQESYFSTPVFINLPILFLTTVLLSFILIYSRSKDKIFHYAVTSAFIIWVISHLPFDGVSPYTLRNLSLHYFKPWIPFTIFYALLGIDRLFKVKLQWRNLKPPLIAIVIFLIIPLTIHFTKPKLLDTKGWSVTASANSLEAKKMLDKNEKTAWQTENPRKINDSITIDMQKTHRVNRLILIDEVSNAAVNFDILLSIDGKNWEKLSPNYTYNVRGGNGWNVLGYMKNGRYIKILLNEQSSLPWRVNEIYVFGY